MGHKTETIRVGSLPGIRRLPFYLNILREMQKERRKIISAVSLAEVSGQAVSVVKKDIEMTGATGKTGVGYRIDQLIVDIEDFLGWNNSNDTFLVGVGHLGSALLGYGGFKQYGLTFVAAFDNDPHKIGTRIHDVEVIALDKLSSLAERMRIKTGVITVPAPYAQEAADLLVQGGVKRIWSFAPTVIVVPDDVVLQREDLAAGLAELMVKCRVNDQQMQSVE